MKIRVLASILGLLLLIGCAKEPRVAIAPTVEPPAKKYFDAVLRGSAPYILPGVSGYSVRSYQVENDLGDVVTVRITFASQAGTDLVKTKRFAVDKSGRLAAMERADIQDAIRTNLTLIALAAKRANRINGAPISWGMLVEQKLINPDTLRRWDGEDYSKVKIRPAEGVGDEVALTDATGEELTVRFDRETPPP